MLSVIMRTKDRHLLLRRAIESVLAQTVSHWELVLVNDGGDDKALEALLDEPRVALRQRCGARLQMVHHERSRGMEAASNSGIAAARGDLLALLDDDDTWHPSFVEKTTRFLQQGAALPLLGGVATHATVIHEEIRRNGGVDVVVPLRAIPFNPQLRKITLGRMAARNQMPLHTFVYLRKVYDEIGPYREDLPVLGDWEFNLRFLQRYEIAVLPEPLAYYHMRIALAHGAYSNTVIGGSQQHHYYDAYLRNEALRADQRAGRAGLGLLLGMADGTGERGGVQGVLREVHDALLWRASRVPLGKDLLSWWYFGRRGR